MNDSLLPPATVIRKEKERMKRLVQLERRRIERTIAHHLESKDGESLIREKLEEKERVRLSMLEQKQQSMAKERCQQQVESMIRQAMQMEALEEGRVAALRAAEERHTAAEKRLASLEKERKAKEAAAAAEAKKKEQRIKEVLAKREKEEILRKEALQARLDQHEEQLEKAVAQRDEAIADRVQLMRLKESSKERNVARMVRAEEFRREQLLEKVEKDEQRAQRLAQDRITLKKERGKISKKIQNQRDSLHEAVEDAQKTGDVQHVFKAMESVFGKSTNETADARVDKNLDAETMARNSSVVGTVKKGSYDYYKIRVDNPEAVIKLRLVAKSGDPDLFVGGSTCPYPTVDDYVWGHSSFGDDKVTIYYFDEKFACGWFYIAVYGATASSYTLYANWKASPDEVTVASTLPALAPQRGPVRSYKMLVKEVQKRIPTLSENVQTRLEQMLESMK